ncbi:MAG: GtrA family protein [Proteobacteria bacterium]|nr:GtrA family protein [Pseudomonadota bacterium]
MLERLRPHLPSFLRYIAIGGFVFIIDFGSYAAILNNDITYWKAAAISQIIAFITHFLLNKHLNFRNHDRPTSQQFATYLVVALFCLGVGIAVVQWWIWIFGASRVNAYIAKCVAVGVNIPIGFIGHKKLTFGQGLKAVVIKRQQAA